MSEAAQGDPFADVPAEPTPLDDGEGEGLTGYNPSEGEAPPGEELEHEQTALPEPDPSEVMQDPEEDLDDDEDEPTTEPPEAAEPEADPLAEPEPEPDPEVETPVEGTVEVDAIDHPEAGDEIAAEQAAEQEVPVEEPTPEPEAEVPAEEPPPAEEEIEPPDREPENTPLDIPQPRSDEDEFIAGVPPGATSKRNRNYIVFEAIKVQVRGSERTAWVRVGQAVGRNGDVAKQRGFKALCRARGSRVVTELWAVAVKNFDPSPVKAKERPEDDFSVEVG